LCGYIQESVTIAATISVKNLRGSKSVTDSAFHDSHHREEIHISESQIYLCWKQSLDI
jgi:hypothetical protein